MCTQICRKFHYTILLRGCVIAWEPSEWSVVSAQPHRHYASTLWGHCNVSQWHCNAMCHSEPQWHCNMCHSEPLDLDWHLLKEELEKRNFEPAGAITRNSSNKDLDILRDWRIAYCKVSKWDAKWSVKCILSRDVLTNTESGIKWPKIVKGYNESISWIHCIMNQHWNSPSVTKAGAFHKCTLDYYKQ